MCIGALSLTHTHTRMCFFHCNSQNFSPKTDSRLPPSIFWTTEKVLKSSYSNYKIVFMVVKAKLLSCISILEMAGP